MEPKIATIGLDVGGTKTSGVLLSPEDVLRERERIPTKRSSRESVVGGILDVCERLSERAEVLGLEVAAIGVGFAGFIDFSQGLVIYSPNLPIEDLRLKDVLEERLSMPAFVDNDANVAALAESRWGAGRSVEHMVHITLGTGIGGGVIIDRQLYRGCIGTAAEIGHIVISAGGPLCFCGARVCFEAMASGTAIERMALEAATANPDSPLARLRDRKGHLDVQLLSEAAREGDPLALDIFLQAGYSLGVGIANLINIFNPERVVLSGGVTNVLDLLEERMQVAVKEIAVKPSRESTRIVTSELQGEEVGARGAALLAMELSGRFPVPE